MAKRTKKELTPEVKPEPKRQFSKDEIQAGLDVVHSEYFMHVVGLLSHDPDNKNLDFVRVPVQTPQGGLYLVSILHVDGPKVSLPQIGEAADAFLKEQEKEKADGT